MDIRPLSNSGPASAALAEAAASAHTARATATAKSSATLETAAAVQQSTAAPSAEQVTQAVKNINASLQSLSQGVEFSVDEDSNATVVRVIDQDTKEVLRQMPSKEALEIARALDRVQGMLIKQKA